MTEVFYVQLKGSTFSNEDGVNRQDLVKLCRLGQRLSLRAEPNNPHDRHAVAVLDSSGRMLGHLPSDARDASDLARGRIVTATVERIVGGANLLQKLVGIQRNYGMVIRLEKEPIDWSTFNALRAIAEKVDKASEAALKAAKSDDSEKALSAFSNTMKLVIGLNQENPAAAGHRQLPAPINKFTTLLVKARRFDDAMSAYTHWKSVPDPIGLPKADEAALEARMERVRVKAQQSP